VSPVWLTGAEPRLRGATVGGEPSLTGEGYLKGPPLFEALFSRVFIALQEVECTEGLRSRAQGTEWSQGICRN
jgi:hypothetical protein